MATQAASEDESWRELAACRGMSVDIFFPLGTPGMTEYDEAVREAKIICAWCPVKSECLDFAMRSEGRASGNDDMGIYGGMTHKERNSRHRRNLEAARRARG